MLLATELPPLLDELDRRLQRIGFERHRQATEHLDDVGRLPDSRRTRREIRHHRYAREDVDELGQLFVNLLLTGIDGVDTYSHVYSCSFMSARAEAR